MQIKESFKKCGEKSGEKNPIQPTFHLQSNKVNYKCMYVCVINT